MLFQLHSLVSAQQVFRLRFSGLPKPPVLRLAPSSWPFLAGLAESINPPVLRFAEVTLFAQTLRSRSEKVLKNFAKGSRL